MRYHGRARRIATLWLPPLPRSRVIGSIFLLGLVLSACAGPSNEQIAAFANSGISFTRQIPDVYDYAFQRAVQRESADLIKQRKRLTDLHRTDATSLAQAYQARRDSLVERRDQFRKMKAQAAKLGEYFVALHALSAGATSDAAGSAADGIARQLDVLAPEIKAIKIGNSALTSLFKPVAGLAVSTFANAKLQEHLKKHAKSVQEAIALQRTMFELLVKIETGREKEPADAELRLSFLKLDSDIPADWPQKWAQSFNVGLASNPVSAAESAATELESAFRQLVESGRSTLARVERSIALIDAIVTIYRGNPPGAEQ